MRVRELLIGLLVGGAVGGFAWAQSRPPAAQVQSGPGRWQIVNGTPEFTQNIMLLDSATGNTWQTCKGPDGTELWCFKPRTNGTGGTSPQRPQNSDSQPGQ